MIAAISILIAVCGAALLLILFIRIRNADKEQKLDRHRSKAMGFADLLVYAAVVEEGVIVGKNGSLMAAWIFRDPEVQRLVGEPDVRNHKVLVRLAQAGFSFGRVIHMPHKTAILTYLSRVDFERMQGSPPPPAPVKPPLRGLRLAYHLGISRVGRRLGFIACGW